MINIRNIILFAVFNIVTQFNGFAQCSMCRAVVESDITGKGAGINNAIVYLMAIPYVLIGILALAFILKMRRDKVRFSV